MLSSFIDNYKFEFYNPKEILKFLIPGNNAIYDVMNELQELMVKVDNSNILPTSAKKNYVITNPILFEGFLFILKRYIDSIISARIKDSDIQAIVEKFTFLRDLASTKYDTNKYYCGKSVGLVELVEYLFKTMITSGQYKNEIENRIMRNRMKVVDQCSTTLLECLKESLPYHTEPNIMKRYLKLIPSLAYSIREADTNQHNFTSPGTQRLSTIRHIGLLPKGNLYYHKTFI